MVNQFSSDQLLTFTRSAIAAYITGHRDDAIALLRLYGAQIPDNISDDMLTVAVLKGMKDNVNFRGQLKNHLHATVNETLSSPAIAYSNYTEDERYMNATTTATPTAAPASSTQNKSYLGQIFSADTLSNILNTGLNILSGSLQNKSSQQGDAAALQEEADRLAKVKSDAAIKDEEKKHKGVILPIIITVSVLGLAYWGWRIYKKKHR